MCFFAALHVSHLSGRGVVVLIGGIRDSIVLALAAEPAMAAFTRLPP